MSDYKPTLEEMWDFIDGIMRPNALVPDKSILSYDEVFLIYSKLVEIDDLFVEIAHAKMLKKALEGVALTHSVMK